MKRIVAEVDKCLACRTCEFACAVAHSGVDDLLQAIEAGAEPRIHVEMVDEATVLRRCRHCRNAPCVAKCPTGALARANPDDPVLLNEELCDGCGECVKACPFHVIRLSGAQPKALKCDLCAERQAAGLDPACVLSCPTGALVYGEPASVVRYEIDAELCTACGRCRRRCPVEAITGDRDTPHVIDQGTCIRCGLCRELCNFDAVAEVHLTHAHGGEDDTQ